MSSSRLCSQDSEKITRKFLDTWSYAISMNSKTYENECLQLIDLLDQTRLKWKNTEAERTVYSRRFQELQTTLERSEETIINLKKVVVERDGEISSLKTKNDELLKELDEYRQKWGEIREKLNNTSHEIEHYKYVNTSQEKQYTGPSQSNENTTTVSSSLLQPLHITPRRRVLSPIYNDSEDVSVADFSATSNSSIDYDKTGDSFDMSSGAINARRISRKRRSRSQQNNNRRFRIDQDSMIQTCPSKRSRNEESIVATATITVDPKGIRKPSGSLAINRMRKRSMSESTLTDIGAAYSKINAGLATPVASGTNAFSGIESSWTNGQPIEKRTHRVTAFWPLLESCDVCNKRFGLTNSDSLRCLDCCIRFHRHCHKSAPMPCVPQVKVQSAGKNQKLPLKCYCPKRHPMIPPLIIHCIVALEDHRLTREGIYRIPGSETLVKKLYNEFLTARVVPNLSNVDTETITGVIKRFLRELRDALIPPTSFEDFKNAVESNSNEKLEQAILELPNANRDTLAFFLQHLQNVAKFSTENMMPLENLCRVLAPTIVGYSSFVTTTYANQELITKGQFAILYRLLKMPHEYWRQFVDKNMAAVIYERTPRIRNLTPQSSRLDTRKQRNLKKQHTESSPLIQPLNVTARRGPIFEENLI